jgi:hypothetical protein
MVNGVLGGLRAIQGPLNSVLSLLGIQIIQVGSNVDFTSAIKNAQAKANGLNNFVQFMGKAGGFGDFLSGGALPTMPGTTSGNAGASGSSGVRFASGSIIKPVPGGVWGNIGESRHSEAIIPLSPSILAQIGAGIGGGGGGDTLVRIDGGQFDGLMMRVLGRQSSRSTLTQKMGRA